MTSTCQTRRPTFQRQSPSNLEWANTPHQDLNSDPGSQQKPTLQATQPESHMAPWTKSMKPKTYQHRSSQNHQTWCMQHSNKGRIISSIKTPTPEIKQPTTLLEWLHSQQKPRHQGMQERINHQVWCKLLRVRPCPAICEIWINSNRRTLEYPVSQIMSSTESEAHSYPQVEGRWSSGMEIQPVDIEASINCSLSMEEKILEHFLVYLTDQC